MFQSRNVNIWKKALYNYFTFDLICSLLSIELTNLISQKYYTDYRTKSFLFNAKINNFKNCIFGYEVQYLFLFKQYPLIEDFKGLSNGTSNDVVHMYFSSQRSRNAEWVPFLITILMVFLYVYFSIKRIEFVKSKFGIALTAIATVICATCMSLGLR